MMYDPYFNNLALSLKAIPFCIFNIFLYESKLKLNTFSALLKKYYFYGYKVSGACKFKWSEIRNILFDSCYIIYPYVYSELVYGISHDLYTTALKEFTTSIDKFVVDSITNLNTINASLQGLLLPTVCIAYSRFVNNVAQYSEYNMQSLSGTIDMQLMFFYLYIFDYVTAILSQIELVNVIHTLQFELCRSLDTVYLLELAELFAHIPYLSIV